MEDGIRGAVIHPIRLYFDNTVQQGGNGALQPVSISNDTNSLKSALCAGNGIEKCVCIYAIKIILEAAFGLLLGHVADPSCVGVRG